MLHTPFYVCLLVLRCGQGAYTKLRQIPFPVSGGFRDQTQKGGRSLKSQVGYCASYGALGHVPASTSRNLFFMLHFVATKVWRQSLMSNVFRILDTTVVKITLITLLFINYFIFHFIEKNEKGISDSFVTQCSHILCYFTYVTQVISMSFCGPPRAKSWRRRC